MTHRLSALETKERIRTLLQDIHNRSEAALDWFDKAPGQVADNCSCIELAAVEIMNHLEAKR